jgi:PAS domain S-box-containing protein
MTGNPNDPRERADLRSRALAHLTEPGAQPRVRTDASAALGVLYELASSPSTAPNALALLHGLQVHQVEVDLQDEELRRSRVELETALNRQVHLYDSAPVAYFTVDRNTVRSELNLPGASLLGFDREFLLGRSLDSFLTPDSVRMLHAMLERVTKGAAEVADLQLRGQDGRTRRVHAAARRDPAGECFLIAWIEAADAQPASAT